MRHTLYHKVKIPNPSAFMARMAVTVARAAAITKVYFSSIVPSSLHPKSPTIQNPWVGAIGGQRTEDGGQTLDCPSVFRLAMCGNPCHRRRFILLNGDFNSTFGNVQQVFGLFFEGEGLGDERGDVLLMSYIKVRDRKIPNIFI